jgi:hypothetical protein
LTVLVVNRNLSSHTKHAYSLNADQTADWQPTVYHLSHSAVSFLRWWEEAPHEVCRTSDDFDNLIHPTVTLLPREKDWLDAFLEVLCRYNDSLESTAEAIVGIVRQRPLSHNPEWNGNRIFSASENHTDRLPVGSKLFCANEYLVAFREQYAIEIWALKVQRNYQLFRQAHQQMEMMLLGIPYAPVNEILSNLEYTQIVLLSSATTVTGQDFSTLANCLKTRDWTKNEEARFCSKFTSFMPGRWEISEILNSWEKLVKVS